MHSFSLKLLRCFHFHFHFLKYIAILFSERLLFLSKLLVPISTVSLSVKQDNRCIETI